MLLGKFEHISHILGVDIAEIVKVEFVIGLVRRSGFHVLHVRHVLAIKWLQVVLMC